MNDFLVRICYASLASMLFEKMVTFSTFKILMVRKKGPFYCAHPNFFVSIGSLHYNHYIFSGHSDFLTMSSLSGPKDNFSKDFLMLLSQLPFIIGLFSW